MFKRPNKQLTREEEIEQYRKYQEWARQQTWVTVEAPDGSLLRVTAEEAKAYREKMHPILHRGKTLDELVLPSRRLEAEVQELREQGLTDKEIWETLSPESKAKVDFLWDGLPADWSPKK